MQKKEKTKLAIIIGAIIIMTSIFFVPYEQWIFRLKTPEQALRFSYRRKVKEIIVKKEFGDNAYIIYANKDGSLAGAYIPKDERGWIPPKTKLSRIDKLKGSVNYMISSYKKKDENVLVINTFSLDEQRIVSNISDSINTEFKSIDYIHNEIHYRLWIGIVKEYPENYEIYLDDEIVKF